MRIRTYRELKRIDSYEDRFEYLSLHGVVGDTTFGFDRWINQQFYRSIEWKRARDEVIVRDNGCDMGISGFEISERVLVHHMNPLTAEQIENGDYALIDPDNLICVTHDTHNAIHYGDASLLRQPWEPRRPGDTKLW